MLHFRRADAVGERAESAVGGGVAVAANQRGARQGEALLRPDDVDDALALVELVEIFEPEELGILRQVGDLRRALGVGIGQVAVGGRHVVIDHAQRLLGRAHLAAGQTQTFERLRARHLMHEVAVDVDETCAVRLLIHQVVVPDLVVEGARLAHIPSRELRPLSLIIPTHEKKSAPISAVSYTHLDVYKRQCHSRSSARARSAASTC